MKMRLCYLVVFGLVLLVASFIACGPHVPSTASADREALAALVQELDAAYNAQDAARFSAVFVEDGNFCFPLEGLALHGRDEINLHFAKQFVTHPELRHITKTGEIDAISPDILAVDTQVDILVANPKTGTAQTPLFHYQGLGLGIRTKSGWRIRLVRLYPMAKLSAAAPRTNQ